MARTLGSKSSTNLQLRSCTFFISSRITHASRRLTLTTVAMALLFSVLGGTGDVNAAPTDCGHSEVSIVKQANGDDFNFKFSYDSGTVKGTFKSSKSIGHEVERQDEILEYFPAASQGLDQDELLANRLGLMVGAIGNTLSQLFFGTKELRSDVTFWCANPNRPDYIQMFVNDPDIHHKLDITKPIMLLTHGWTDNVNRTWVKDIVADYIENEGGNICAVDWSRLALVEYHLAAKNTPQVGRYLSKFIKFLLRQGFNMDQLTLVGHSMGAHISGIAGAALDGTVPMIIGLDPAGPAFTRPFLVPEDKRLDKNDAVFVQAIHTDKNIIGTSTNVGHQDFFTNSGGSPQPGCEFPLVNNDTTKAYLQFICSHFKAVEYFRASLNPKNIFEGTNCNSYYYYRRGECSNNTRSDFGLQNNKKAFGPLYISIDKTVYPYAKTIARNT